MNGVLAPVLTPFDGDLAPDAGRFIRHCRWLLAQGCSALAVFGTTSEANSLSVDEREQLLGALLEAGIEPAQLLPGTGCCALTDTVRLTRLAARSGCAGVLMLPPFYYKGISEDGVFRSYAEVIERVPESRIYLYHIPQLSQVPITLKLIERLLARYGRTIAGIKDSSGDFANTRAMLDAFPGFEVFSGSEKFLLATLRGGGAGCITATANLNPAEIVRAFRGWQTQEAEALQARIDRVRAIFEQQPLMPGLKEALAHFSGDDGFRALRPPLTELAPAQRAALVAALTAAKFSLG